MKERGRGTMLALIRRMPPLGQGPDWPTLEHLADIRRSLDSGGGVDNLYGWVVPALVDFVDEVLMRPVVPPSPIFKAPHLCPKCKGEGTADGSPISLNPTTLICHPCGGAGIVWG